MGQTAPAVTPAGIPASVDSEVLPAQKVLFKIGLNAGRALRSTGYYGVGSLLPVTVGAEYLLSPKFTVYSQVDTDFNLFDRERFPSGRSPFIPAGAFGVGFRYYGTHDHKPFEGLYVGAEFHTEMLHRYNSQTNLNPALNVICGTQHRVGSSLLVDLNAGVGIGGNQRSSGGGYYAPPLAITTQLNLGICFAR